MSEYYNVTTNAGDAAIATAIANNSKLNITHVAFGDGNGSVPTPDKTRNALVHEVHRQAVTKYTKHPSIANYIVIETIIPSNVGGFWIREMGIIADNVLISHGSHAPFFKVADPEGVSEYRLKFTQDVRDGSVVEIVLDESLIYASQAWVNENYIRRNELIDNLTTNEATKPLTAKQGKKLQDDKFDKSGGTVDGDLRVNGLAYIKRIRGDQDLWITSEDEQNGRRVLTGGLLVSNSYSQANLIPNFGIYSAGAIHAGGNVYSDEYRGYTKNPVFYGALSGNADSASKLATSRNIAFSGAATGSFNFDGSTNASCLLTLANSGVTASTYGSNIIIPVITFNAKGLATVVSTQTIRSASTSQTGVVQLTDDLLTDDASKALTAKQGKALQDNKLDKTATAVAAKKLALEQTSFNNDSDFIQYFKDKSTAFFDNTGGKFFLQFSSGLVSSLIGGGTFIIASDVISGKTKIISCVVQENGAIDYLIKKELAYTDSDISGNSASSTKLKNTRKIFGLDFDGTNDVAGNITTTTGMVASDSYHYIDMGRSGVDRMNLAVYSGIFNFINTQNGNVIARLNSNGIDCNAATATKLQNQRTINGVAFDGTQDITITAEQRLNGGIGNESQLNAALTAGIYVCSSDNGLAGIYGYGFLQVYRSGGVISQVYYPHLTGGSNEVFFAARQSWDSGQTWGGWYYSGKNADSASKLKTARNIALSGAVSGNANFDGSGNINISTTPNNSVRAFINFNMNTGAIRKSSGIASVTSLGSGVYRINLSQAAPDANYAVVGMASWRGSAGAAVNMWDDANNLPNQNSFCINCSWGGDNTAGTYNPTYVNLAILY
ncbi:hypothetical protein D7V21_09460 [Acinetobacter guerrae]|uniref:Phage tail fibre protein N-terminal domain-containing protein n=1 Tax=Acinetobacter guerrae TaxID=1843371 RepID=A0A3A8EWZ7_9GAMM|nr:phage tail protein [Acinetobacter guerrae]RKG33391.1 hypothetical protein D7V21_09460 [Acinetobacter guerrae]